MWCIGEQIRKTGSRRWEHNGSKGQGDCVGDEEWEQGMEPSLTLISLDATTKMNETQEGEFKILEENSNFIN